MPPFQRLTRDLYAELRISSQLESIFRIALGQAPRRGLDNESFKGVTTDRIRSNLAVSALTNYLPTYVATTTLHNVVEAIQVSTPEPAPALAIHDDMPIAIAVRMMEKTGADTAMVSTASGPRYVRLGDLKYIQNGMKNAFRSEAGHTITEMFSLNLPEVKSPRGFDRLYDAATDVLCQLQTWYQCQEDNTCIMNRSDCPRDPSHPTLWVDASACCL